MKKKILFLTLAAVAGLTCTIAGKAQADRDDDRSRDRDWDRHEQEARDWHRRHWHHDRVVYENGEPYVTYAPPVVVAPPPPPPIYYEPQAGVNIVVPLHIR